MLNHIKHNSQSFSYPTKLVKNKYMSSHSFDNQFITKVRKNNKSNNIDAIIEELFLNIEYSLLYKKWIKKIVYKTYEFVMHFTRHMSSKDWVAFYEIKTVLKTF